MWRERCRDAVDGSSTEVSERAMERDDGDHEGRRGKTELVKSQKKEEDDEECKGAKRGMRRHQRRSKRVEAHLAWRSRESNTGVGDMVDEPHTVVNDPLAMQFDEYDAKGIVDPPALIHDV